MKDFILREIVSKDLEEELLTIGFDSSYRNFAKHKFEYKNIKIFGMTPAQANIIKQTAISVGADCATHREVITGKAELSDVILGGSFSQIKKVAEKLKFQPFSLKDLGEKLILYIQNNERKTKITGILNVTPDSFSDGGKYFDIKSAREHLIEMIESGADMIDIGAESTRPSSKDVSAEEQIKRLKPILEFVQKEIFQIPISVDTRSSVVADFALNNGANIINDVSGFDYDSDMPKVIAKYHAGVIIQHSRGNSSNMQSDLGYKNLMDEIYLCLRSKIQIAQNWGIKNIIVDPGIGFGKTREQNFEILDRVEEFYYLNTPVMIGVSRKSLLGIKEDNNELKDALTLAVSYPLIQKGVDYLRVHNVSLHKKLLNLVYDK